MWLAGAAHGDEAGASRRTALGPPATAPAAVLPPKTPDYENIEIHARKPGASALKNAGEKESLTGGAGLGRIGMALAIVIGLILVARWVARRWFAAGAGAGGLVVQVLARSTVSPRQQVVLLQVGRRLIVAASSGTQMSTLCEITDQQEISELVGQIQQKKAYSVSASFRSLFGRATRDFDEAAKADDAPQADGAKEGQAPAEPELATTRAELSGLLDRVRTLSAHFRRA
jgi:flagellar biogenesis protein FliO